MTGLPFGSPDPLGPTEVEVDAEVDAEVDGEVDGDPDTATLAGGDPAVDGELSDGRRRRRDRNREAVVDAMLSLYREGSLQPSAAEIAERAGLSQRSLFRYFADLDDLGRLAISRALQQVVHLVPIRVAADAPLEERIRGLAAQRVNLFDQVAPAASVVRLRAPFHEVVRGQLDRTRRFLRRQIDDLLGPELAALGPDAAQRAGDVIDVLTSFEAHQLFRLDRQLSAEATIDLLAATIALQLAHPV